MESFKFSKENPSPAIPFYGPLFYRTFKEAEFLRDTENVLTILSKSHELRLNMKKVEPGKLYKVDGFYIFKKPLLVKKSGANVKVEGHEFTHNRLMGFTAAYVYENRHLFPEIDASEPKELGLSWNHTDDDKSKLYLSAISGSEHFLDQFEYWPLICALRKYQLKKLPLHLVIKAAKIKNDNGVTMAELLKQNYKGARAIWSQFPKTTQTDLITLLAEAPPELKSLFLDV